jgi:truncated hemoglobin YjbI
MSGGMSYFDELGGTPTVQEAVDRFYRLVLDDGELAGYFDGVDISTLTEHQVKLISHVLGGPNGYAGRDLGEAHGHLGVTDAHYQKVGAYLTGVLTEMGARDEIITAVGATLAGVAPQVVTKPDGGGAS